jgi:DNA-binding transcriptional ArsR family regulator
LPQIIETASGYKYDWGQEQITIDVERIRNHSDRVTCQLNVSTTSPGYDGSHIYGPVSFNLCSMQSRRQLEKILTEKCTEAPWYVILEQLCNYTLDRVHRGEPVQELWGNKELSPPKYLVEPFLIENYPNVIFGEPSSAKSTFALILSQLLLLPWHDNPLFLPTPETSCPSLYLDYETDRQTVQYQLSLLERGMDLPPLMVHYRYCSVPLPQDIDQIRGHIEATKARVLIIDSLGLACGGDLKEASSAIAFFSALRQLKTTSLILAHTNKDKEQRNKSIFGSQYFTAQARNIWEIRKVQEADENEIRVGLFHTKPAPFQKKQRALGFRLSFNNESLTVSPIEAQSVPEFLQHLGTQRQIEELLKEGPQTTAEIMQNLELSRGAADMALKRLRGKKKVVRIEKDKWGLQTSSVPFNTSNTC